MIRVRGPAGIALALLLFGLVACVQEVERGGANLPTALSPSPTPTATLFPTATATPIPTPPPPTPTATPRPTPVPTLRPTLTPTPTVDPASRLRLDVRAPSDGSTVRGDAVVVYGGTTPGALVTIGDMAAEVGPDGRFQAEIALSPGINVVVVAATDSQGNRVTRLLNVTSLALPPQPFLLLVTEPKDQSVVSTGTIRLSGRTGAEAIASVNGVSVSVDELGFFSTDITLDPGPNIIEVVATNNDGRELSTVLAVIFRP